MNNKIIIIAGDPNSVNSEIIFKTWKKLNSKIREKIYFIGSYNLIKSQFKKLNYNIKIFKIQNIQIKNDKFKVIDIPLNFKNPFKITNKNASKYVLKCLNKAHALTNAKLFKGLINCPINKNLLNKSKNIGVTEYLASKCQIKNNSEVMMIYNKKLSVVPITTHLQLKNVPNRINKKLIIKKVITLNKEFKAHFKKRPKIAVLGLNPHNNEFSINSEEYKEIIPAINKLKKIGINVNGPFSSDSFFINNYKNFNVLVGMYHDQVLTPFKALFHFDAINITLGLNYMRVSPDHGPALNLIGKKSASSLSLLRCIQFINKRN
tara:strand:+ start:361 stop:1320 length:960 start_codon:yes stop_codon:yes gene_type:complete